MRIYLCLLLAVAPLLAQNTTGDKSAMMRKMDERAAHYGDVSRKIWGFAELGFKETQSAALLVGELRAAGFTIVENVGGMPTAFTATWGQGKPVIGIMGEYDALPGLSQDATPERKPLVEGGPGHGCGHNLLGTASLFAAVMLKEWLAANKMPGTIRFYGTPAEEGGDGKLYMIRAGAFKDVDTVLSWHPADHNGASLTEFAGHHLGEVPLPWQTRARLGGARCGALRARWPDDRGQRHRDAARARARIDPHPLRDHQRRRRAQHRARLHRAVPVRAPSQHARCWMASGSAF